ncbi:MAG: sulfurtransferase [Syntrophales bacterium]
MKTRRVKVFVLSIAFLFVLPLFAAARDIAPVVSVDWLEKNLNDANLVVVDIRKVEEYKEGNIPNSVNVFYGTWAIKKKGLDNELPEDDDLFDVIGSAGIKAGSRVVIAGNVDAVVDQVNLTRVAWTLIYGGVDNVAILDGGFKAWKEAKKAVSPEARKPKAVTYQGKVNKSVVASKEYVISKIGKSSIIDTRMPDFFFGVSKLPFVEKAGRIKNSVSLPSAWIFTKEGKFKGKDDLEAMAAGVIGKDTAKESIAYCDTGRLASGWWFVLREVLGYKDVKSYDGSSQEFTKDPNVPMAKYTWCN